MTKRDDLPEGDHRTRGAWLIAAGTMMMVLCGLCTGNVLRHLSNGTLRDGYIALPMLPIFGLGPILVGALLIFLGVRDRRS